MNVKFSSVKRRKAQLRKFVILVEPTFRDIVPVRTFGRLRAFGFVPFDRRLPFFPSPLFLPFFQNFFLLLLDSPAERRQDVKKRGRDSTEGGSSKQFFLHELPPIAPLFQIR